MDWRVKSRIQHSEIGGGERGTHHGKCYTGVYIWMCLVRVVALLSHMLYVCMRERKYVYWPYLNNWLPSLLGLSAHHVYTSIYPSFSLSHSLTHSQTHTHTHTDICCVNIASVNRPLAVSSKHREHVSTSPRFRARGHSVCVCVCDCFCVTLSLLPTPSGSGLPTHTHSYSCMHTHALVGPHHSNHRATQGNNLPAAGWRERER